MYRILVINPGSTSTKIAMYEDEKEAWSETITYRKEDLDGFNRSIEQLEMRRIDIMDLLKNRGVDLKMVSAVVGRGGPFRPLGSGTYLVDEKLLDDIKMGNVQADHISNIGAVLAHELAEKAGVSAYFVDPVSVDEFEPIARISGIPELERISLLHTLNIRATAYRAARDLGKSLTEINLIVAHLGGGISICPIRKGRIIDVNNANEGGPFSPERSGSLPVSSLVKLCYSGKFSFEEMKKRIVGNGGLVAYLGTNDSREVERRIEKGDEDARLIYEAMAYQIAKEIGAMSSVLKGSVDCIVITGGLANSVMLVEWIKERISFIAPVYIYGGENEMEALAHGVLRVLRKEEMVKKY